MEYTPHWTYHVPVISSPYSSDHVCKTSTLTFLPHICQDIWTPTFSNCNFKSTFHFLMHTAHPAHPILYLDNTTIHNAMPWLRQLVAGLLTWTPLFNQWTIHVGCILHSGTATGFSQSTFGLPLSISFHQCPHLFIYHQCHRISATGNANKNTLKKQKQISYEVLKL